MIGRVVLSGAVLLSFSLLSVGATLDQRIDAGWRVQRRWTAVSANGSFLYDFALKTWNGAGRLKESVTRSVRMTSRGGTHASEILAATRDGRDDTERARAEERQRAGTPERGNNNDFPSPFDPQFRDRYVFTEAPSPDGRAVLSFRPRTLFDRAVEGRAFFDATGGLRRVEFTLAKRPAFTKRLALAIMIGETGLPESVESSGEISLVVWKRRFESTLALHDVRPGGKDAP